MFKTQEDIVKFIEEQINQKSEEELEEIKNSDPMDIYALAFYEGIVNGIINSNPNASISGENVRIVMSDK